MSWQVQRCPKGHWQLVRYLDYLTERDCVRPLEPARLDELRQHVQQIRCSGCGASVDLERHAACTHCGANLSVLDAAATADAIARLTQERDRKDKTIDPQELAAVLEVDRLRAEQHARRMDRIYSHRGSGEFVLTGLVEAGLALLFGLLE